MPQCIFPGLLLVLGVLTAACILRPGMNAECAWPPESPKALNLAEPPDARHLVLDTEVLEELIDRHRFHPVEERQRCEPRLIAEIASVHSVTAMDVARAREQIPNRGLDLPVTLPVAALFVLSVSRVLRWIDRRFPGEPIPTIVCLVVASVALSAAFVFLGEFWTSCLQMIRVWSHHVGGRVHRMLWLTRQKEIFVIGVAVFWTIVFLCRLVRASPLFPQRSRPDC